MKKFVVILIVCCLYSCGGQKNDPFIIESLNTFNGYLFNRIYEVGYNDYHLKYMDSEDSIEIEKKRYSYKLYEINNLVDSLSNFITNAVIDVIGIEQYKLDTLSYKSIINDYDSYFTRSMLTNTRIKNTFEKMVTQQKKIRDIREEIIGGQKGKGKIICMEVGFTFKKDDLKNCRNFYETFYTIEKLTCTLYKEMLCTYSNLHSYNKTIKYDYIHPYGSHYSSH